MTIAEAREILDAARAGVELSQRIITRALRVTGDLRQHRKLIALPEPEAQPKPRLFGEALVR